MNCAGCGRDNPAGARYCVHCGAEQATPTPIAVAAAAMATRPRSPVPHAANAPRAEVTHDGGRSGSRATRHPTDAWSGDTQAPAFPAGSDTYDLPIANPGSASSRTPPPPGSPAAAPVYAAHPRRLGVAVLLIAACVIVALVAFVAWKARQGEPAAAGGDRDGSVMSAFPPDATPQRARRADAPAPAMVAEPSASPAAPAQPALNAHPVEIKPLPAKPAHRTAAVATPVPNSTAPASPAVVAESAPAPDRPQTVAAAPKAPAADRWTQMNDELSRCTREDFISRVICDQRVRFRYCNGYWGKTPQCPGNPAPERGQ